MIFNKKEGFEENEDEQNVKKFEMSPKMTRSLKETDEINEYKYEEIEKIIEEDEDGLDEGLVPIQSIVHKSSDRFEPTQLE